MVPVTQTVTEIIWIGSVGVPSLERDPRPLSRSITDSPATTCPKSVYSGRPSCCAVEVLVVEPLSRPEPVELRDRALDVRLVDMLAQGGSVVRFLEAARRDGTAPDDDK